MDLKKQWKELTAPYISNELQEKYLDELYQHYNESNRYYHNLKHISALLLLSNEYQDHIENKELINFSIWYHDVIYNATRKDNELKSADLAKSRMTDMGVSPELIESCHQLIVATKNHEINPTLKQISDARFLMDIDLSILAAEWGDYYSYTQQIRKEYRIYPDFVYKKGRKQVLKHFIEMPEIYKSSFFRNLWEDDARSNMERELKMLN